MATAEQDTFEKRLFKVARDLNVSTDRVVEFLEDEGYGDALTGTGFNASIVDEEAYLVLRNEYADDAEVAARIRELRSQKDEGPQRDEVATLDEEQEAEPEPTEESAEAEEPSVVEEEEEPAGEPAAQEPDTTEEETTEEAKVDEEAAEAEATDEASQEAPAVSEDRTEDPTVVEEQTADEELAEDGAPAAEPEADVEEPTEPESETPPEAETDEEAPAEAEAEGEAPEATEPPDTESVEAEATESVEEEAQPVPEEEEPEPEPTAEAGEVEEPPEEGEDGPSEVPAEETPEAAPEEEVVETPDAEAADTSTSAPAEEAEDQEGASDDEEDTIRAGRYHLSGPQVVGKMEDEQLQRPRRKRKRKRKEKEEEQEKQEEEEEKQKQKKKKQKKQKKTQKGGPDEEDVEQTIQETLQELEQGASRERQRRRRRRRERHERQRQRERERERRRENILEVTEFITTGELANLMGEPVSDVIDVLFDAGMMVSVNQRLDRETIEFVADEYGMEIEFVAERGQEAVEVEEDEPEDLEPRAPVVTVMGHVDHGKTSLLDYIRNANVVAGEEGGITQHVGAHYVELTGHDDEAVTFLDTPGHEAFTAMRARGAKATDIVILVVAADDSVMPQTKEAINHAQAADVPIVVAINKMDKREADPEKVRAELADHNVLVEEYGGDVQAAEVSAETGEGIDDLLEKVVLQSEIMELQANPNREASGVIIESRLEKGRGNVITVLVQNGTLETGDAFLAGIHSGRVRAMFDERDNRVESVGPSQPALVLGCDGSPDVGDQFVVMESETEAREVAQERQRIHREQELRRQSQVSLDQVSRRMAEGEFHELNLIIKADVGGSVEALSDALLKLKTDEVAVSIIHTGVGAISESDVMLARASDAIIIGFQVRPTSGAREAAQREDVDIRTYSVIYSAIEDVRDALEGLLSPERREEMKGRAEVRDTFKVPDVGMVAGCYVNEGTIGRNHKVRVVRDGVVEYEGEVGSLKRFEEDVKEVQEGYECGLSIENFDDIKTGDELEAYVVVEEKRELEV
ncbi:MAG: translation initiation factor IF-2 [Salinibacter sp.]|uniref:translation initiation factor IF-2 n=1 Tax=Salinibacter sp. TaxID=2065818 RepID=UPI0035D3FA8E